MSDIIIAGDWVVDEYWYLVRQHSEISSHTGFVHYRSSSKREDRILDLCSAGHVARVLFTLRDKPGPFYRIWGIGDWNEGDTKQLQHLVHAHAVEGCKATQANFLLWRPLCPNPPVDVTLLPLHKDRPTTRVVRLYHSTEAGIEQLSRIDWERPPDEDKEKVFEPVTLPDGLPKRETVSSIVIHDLCKGAVTPDLITELYVRYPEARWYVRTKSQDPSWLRRIKDNVALFLVGPEVAEPGNPWGSWLSRSGAKITYQSYAYLRDVNTQATLVLSEDREVIGRVNDGKHCVTAKAPPPDSGTTQVGWPSALFAALVHKLHTTSLPWDKPMLEEALRLAHQNAGVPVTIEPTTNPLVSVQPEAHFEPWLTQEQEWNSAMNEKGILSPYGPQPTLEVWRGASDLPGYVACIQGKRDQIIDIGKRLRAFTRSGDPARSLSILLQADPGSGKSHLARLLAEKFKLSPLFFDVSQMLHRDDLLDLFDTVATEQANRPDKRVLVIVDEINALLDNAPVYSSFLAPLEQGVYVRRGRVFSLKPCVWIFAGTDSGEADRPKSVKISDFEERLSTTVKLDYRSLKALASSDKEREDIRKKAKLEQVYLGATIIQQRYPDVEGVGPLVLEKFYELDPTKSPARKIRKMVEELRNVQRAEVTIRNIDVNQPREKDLVRLMGKV